MIIRCLTRFPLRRAIAFRYEGGVKEPGVPTSTTTVAEWRGPVLDVLRQLIGEHERGRQVLAIFEQLVARNSELELQLNELLSRRNKGEGVSTSQLMLFLDRLSAKPATNDTETASNPCSPEIEQANSQLRTASGIDARCGGDGESEPPKPPPQPAVRKAFPEHLEP